MAAPARTSGRIAGLLTAVAVAAPLTAFVGALGTGFGFWTADLGYDLLAMVVAPALGGVGLLSAIVILVLPGPVRTKSLLVGVSLLASVGTLVGYGWHRAHVAAGAVEDVSTDLAEVPGFGRLADARGRDVPTATVGTDACPAARSVPSQASPEAVVYVLGAEGFDVSRAGVTGVYGTRRTFWFGFEHDVVVRIRPGRTDVRVAARDARPHGGEACRLVGEIVAQLQRGT